MAANSKNRGCKFVSFSGIDGAGKSTQIEALRSRLTEAGLRVRLITFWDDVARLAGIREASGHKIFKGDKGVGSPEAPIERRDKNVRSAPMSALRLCLYLLDAMSLRATVKKELRSGADFLICDRYIYDELANLTLTNPAARAYIRVLMRFVPRPDVSYILDADPVAARARKPEYPLDFLHTCRASYLALSELVGGMTIVAPGPVQQVQQRVLKPVLDILSADGLPREQMEKLAG